MSLWRHLRQQSLGDREFALVMEADSQIVGSDEYFRNAFDQKKNEILIL